MGSVGTYTVVIQPRFTKSLGHYNESNGVKYFNFTLDGVRIYDPAGNNATALKKYRDSGEEYTEYGLVRKKISDADLVILDGMTQLKTDELKGYLEGAPKDELYLMPNKTTAFDVNFTNLTDARIGLRAASGTPCTVTIGNGSTTIPISVNTATETYYSLKSLLTAGASTTITISNGGGGGILSVTRLMTTSNSAPSGASQAPRLSVSARTAEVALQTARMLNADIAIDEESVGTATENGTVTVTLKSGADAETIVIRDADGSVVDPDSITYTVDETGVKEWTVVLTESEPGEYTYTLQALYENGYDGGAEPTTVTVTVSFPEDDPETEDPAGSQSYRSLLDRIRGFFARLIELIRRFFSIFA